MVNPFFQNKGPLKVNKVLSSIKTENRLENLEDEILDIKDLVSASDKDITFFHSKKYQHQASTTKARYCITTKNLSNLLPNKCKPIDAMRQSSEKPGKRRRRKRWGLPGGS